MDIEQDEPRGSVLREAHLRDYWKVVWQARWTILAIFVLVVGGTAVWTFLQTPIYRATATLEVQPQAKRVAAGQDVSGLGAAGYGWFAEEKYHNTQVEIIKSRDVAGRVVESLDLDADPYFSEMSDPVEVLRGMIQVVPRRETGLIEISMLGAEPDQITELVNGVADVYVERNFEKARTTVEGAIDEIRNQMTQLQADFLSAEDDRFEALSESTILNTEEQEEIVTDKLKTFNSELTKVQIELNRMRDTLQQIRDMPARGADVQALPELAEDPVLKELSRTRIDLERQLESAKVEYRPGHPQYEKIVSELAKVEQRITDRIGVIVGTLQTRYDLSRQEERYLKAQIKQAEDFSLRMARSGTGLAAQEVVAESKKRVLDLIAKTINEVQLGRDLLTNNVSVLDHATRPLHPIKPRKRVNLAIGAVLGLFLGVAAAFFLDYLDNTFRTPEDIEKYLDLAVLGVVPKTSDQTGLKDRGLREAYQSLRTSIIFSSKNRRRKVVLITSTGPQEGKSSTASYLGQTLAATGDRVVIIDCDLRRPTQHLRFDVAREHGVTNYLAAPVEQTDWADYTKSVGSKSLEIMTSGPIPPNPPELLGSDRFNQLIASMREQFDWVLIDSPPASSLADASILAAMADMMVLVVQYNQTDRDHVAKASQRLRAVNKNLVGVVLNNVDLSRAYDKDYYYANYYYEDAEGGAPKKRRSTPATKVG